MTKTASKTIGRIKPVAPMIVEVSDTGNVYDAKHGEVRRVHGKRLVDPGFYAVRSAACAPCKDSNAVWIGSFATIPDAVDASRVKGAFDPVVEGVPDGG